MRDHDRETPNRHPSNLRICGGAAGHLLRRLSPVVCKRNDWPDYCGRTVTIERSYPQRWFTESYRQARQVEQWLRGRGMKVEVTWRETPGPQ